MDALHMLPTKYSLNKLTPIIFTNSGGSCLVQGGAMPPPPPPPQV